MLVGAIIVDHQVQIQFFRKLSVQTPEKLDELLMPMPRVTLSNHLAFQNFQSGKQRRCAMAHVIMSVSARTALLERQARHAVQRGRSSADDRVDDAGCVQLLGQLAQNRAPEYPDWLGSYKRPPRSNPSAIRNEGLVATYWLEHEFGDPARAVRLLAAIRLTARFQLQTQFRAESVIYLPDPQRAIGGFHGSLTNFRIRIDDVQHNISALLGVHGILGEQD